MRTGNWWGMLKEALPVGSMLIAQFVITILNFFFFYISHHRKSMRAGDWGNMVKEAMSYKARWFTIVVCLTALHSIVAQCWLFLLSSSSQILWHVLEEFASFWRRWWFIIVPGLVNSPQVKSHLCFREAFKSATSFIQNCEVFSSSSNSVNS